MKTTVFHVTGCNIPAYSGQQVTNFSVFVPDETAKVFRMWETAHEL